MKNPETLWIVQLVCLLLFRTTLVYSSSSSNRIVSLPGDKIPERSKPDRFVQAAPLIVAAVCRDGVAVIAAHTSDEDEPLLYYQPDSSTSKPNDIKPFLDLPENFAGPFRIQPIDAYGTTMLTCGWRADCDALVRRAVAMAAAEKRRYGEMGMSASYAKFLSSEISLYLAQCAVSDWVRFGK